MAADGHHLAQTPTGRKRHTPSNSVEQTPEKVVTPRKEHQRVVLTDLIASRYLAEDPSIVLLERSAKLTGYECYIVEQWAVSRTDPTCTITVYTGDAKHIVYADVLDVPSDETTWSPTLKVFFKELNQKHARREATPLGALMVTNLSGFPSYLSVIPIPDGNLIDSRLHFVVNEDLKRMGCLGRMGLTLGPAPHSAITKFYQLYHTSEKHEPQESVVALVRLCQLALYMFDKLEIEYTDGLLCDMTEKAISRWWNDIGTEQFGIEPHDGPLGPTTVAALLGLLMGARNRLRSFGIAMPKDAFELEGMKRGISAFQKQQRLPKTKKLDRSTLSLLIRATAKAAAGDGWAVPKAVKSTVAELSGRGGEMLNGVVGKRDRAGIAEIETTDYDHFVDLVYGQYAKWLWRGKALKGSRAIRHRAREEAKVEDEPPKTPGADTDGSDAERKTGLMKRATDFRNDAKSGLGKFKHAVHIRSRQPASPKQNKERSPQSMPRTSVDEPPKSDYSSAGSPLNGPASPVSPGLERMPDFSITAAAAPRIDNNSANHSRDHSPGSKQVPRIVIPDNQAIGSTNDAAHGMPKPIELKLPEGLNASSEIGPVLRRTVSDEDGLATKSPVDRPNLYPRHLSFALAEDTILPWSDVEASSSDSSLDHDAFYAAKEYEAERQRQLREAISKLNHEESVWTEQQLTALQKLVDQTGVNQLTAEEAYHPRSDAIQSLTTDINVMLRDEQERLEDGTKELETLAARLNYEINGLKGRIEDVDQVVDDFESAVRRVEDRVAELEKNDDKARVYDCTLM